MSTRAAVPEAPSDPLPMCDWCGARLQSWHSDVCAACGQIQPFNRVIDPAEEDEIRARSSLGHRDY